MADSFVFIGGRKVKPKEYTERVNLRGAHIETEGKLARKPREVGVRLKDNARMLAVCKQCIRGSDLLRHGTHRRPPARRQAKDT